MTATLKLGIALLMSGFMFFGPIGCAESMQAATKPAHPCCPKPPAQIPSDCARPGCVYVDVKPMVVEAPASIDHEVVATPEPANIVEQPRNLFWAGVADLRLPAQDHRYLTIHQLLL